MVLRLLLKLVDTLIILRQKAIFFGHKCWLTFRNVSFWQQLKAIKRFGVQKINHFTYQYFGYNLTVTSRPYQEGFIWSLELRHLGKFWKLFASLGSSVKKALTDFKMLFIILKTVHWTVTTLISLTLLVLIATRPALQQYISNVCDSFVSEGPWPSLLSDLVHKGRILPPSYTECNAPHPAYGRYWFSDYTMAYSAIIGVASAGLLIYNGGAINSQKMSYDALIMLMGKDNPLDFPSTLLCFYKAKHLLGSIVWQLLHNKTVGLGEPVSAALAQKSALFGLDHRILSGIELKARAIAAISDAANSRDYLIHMADPKIINYWNYLSQRGVEDISQIATVLPGGTSRFLDLIREFRYTPGSVLDWCVSSHSDVVANQAIANYTACLQNFPTNHDLCLHHLKVVLDAVRSDMPGKSYFMPFLDPVSVSTVISPSTEPMFPHIVRDTLVAFVEADIMVAKDLAFTYLRLKQLYTDPLPVPVSFADFKEQMELLRNFGLKNNLCFPYPADTQLVDDTRLVAAYQWLQHVTYEDLIFTAKVALSRFTDQIDSRAYEYSCDLLQEMFEPYILSGVPSCLELSYYYQAVWFVPYGALLGGVIAWIMGLVGYFTGSIFPNILVPVAPVPLAAGLFIAGPIGYLTLSQINPLLADRLLRISVRQLIQSYADGPGESPLVLLKCHNTNTNVSFEDAFVAFYKTYITTPSTYAYAGPPLFDAPSGGVPFRYPVFREMLDKAQICWDCQDGTRAAAYNFQIEPLCNAVLQNNPEVLMLKCPTLASVTRHPLVEHFFMSAEGSVTGPLWLIDSSFFLLTLASCGIWYLKVFYTVYLFSILVFGYLLTGKVVPLFMNGIKYCYYSVVFFFTTPAVFDIFLAYCFDVFLLF